MTYFHFLCDQHEIVFAEGAATESFHPGREIMGADTALRAELLALFPDLGLTGGAPTRTLVRPLMMPAEAHRLRPRAPNIRRCRAPSGRLGDGSNRSQSLRIDFGGPNLMTTPLRIGLAGLGTVGIGVAKILTQNASTIAARAGRPIKLVAVSARDASKDRGFDLAPYAWETDAAALAARDDVDLLVEVIGGDEGPARAAVEAALGAAKPVVTANKALLATHGQALAELAEVKGAALRFEAAVAGGIPCVKALTEGLAANTATRVMGVLNGTCNYILTEMEKTGAAYADVLAEAQALGYAEADPSFDVGGSMPHKSWRFWRRPPSANAVDFEGVTTEGIENITLADIQLAADMDLRSSFSALRA